MRKPYVVPAARPLLLMEAEELVRADDLGHDGWASRMGLGGWASRIARYAKFGEKPVIRPKPPKAGRIPERAEC